MKYFLLPLILSLSLLFSCDEESDCDRAGYASPLITLTDPEGPDLEIPADSAFTLEFFLSAEAGLNTLSMIENNSDYEIPIRAFTNGEKETHISFTNYYWSGGEIEFVLHDLCDQSTSILLNLTVVQPVY